MVYFIISALIFLFWLVKGADLFVGLGFRTPVLAVRPSGTGEPDPSVPKVSVILAFRDEPDLGQALRSLLAQDYPALEVIAVNDRSAPGFDPPSDPRLVIRRVDSLPAGWLGKTHALRRGYEASSGEWLVFTDADVLFEPGTIAAAAREARARRLDHLALFPRLLNRGYLELVFTQVFAISFNLFFRPWAASNPRSRAFVGIGAFNMIRRDVYEKIGTHAAFPLEIGDDMMLGKLVKRGGFRSMLFLGHKAVSVRWVDGWRGVVSSLRKNAFTGVHYSLLLLVAATVAQIAIGVWPFLAVLCCDGAVRAFAAGSIFMIALIYAGSAQSEPKALAAFPAHPFATLIFLYVLWSSAAATLSRGGVEWRGTFYPLAELKRNHQL